MRFVSYMTPGFPEPLFQALADQIGAELHLVQTMSGPEPGDDPFADGRYDLGWICSTSYVGLQGQATEPSVRLAGVAWVPDDPDNGGAPVYFGDVVVRADSGFKSLADLAGARIGCNDPVSLSGHYAFRWAVDDLGRDPNTFAALNFTGGHHHSLDRLLAGELDAAVVDSVVRIGRSRTDSDVADLRVIERLGPYPVQPLVARSSLDQSLVTEVRQAILGANTDPKMQRLLTGSALLRLVEVGDDHYDTVQARMQDR